MLLLPATEQNTPLMLVEGGMTAIAIAASFAWPRLGNNWFTGIERAFGRLARKQGLACALVGIATLLIRLAILPFCPEPLPFCPDDFSFMLAADTFAHGRLTNPTPAMWVHFESIHITMHPTYMSMYFPGQGLLMAAGKVVLGDPWYALLICSALMCAAICWMLQAWLPPKWALLGSTIAMIRLGLFSYWTNTFHAAGSLAALGGALVLGAMPRLMKTQRIRYAFLMGLGMAILVLTRPYEGVLLCLPVTIVILRWLWKERKHHSAAMRVRIIAAPLVLVVAAGAWMAYYDYRAFGSPFTPPYTVDRAQYAISPYYVWQKARPEPVYRYREMREFYYKGEMDYYTQIHSLTGFLPYTLSKILAPTLLFFSGALLLFPLIMVRRVFLDRRVRFLVVAVLILAAGMAIEIYLLPHYLAVYTAAFYAIGVQMMRHLRQWKPEHKPVGLALVRLTMTACVVLAVLRVFAVPLHFAPNEWPPSSWNFTWYGPQQFGGERARIESGLEQLPGGQLVIVHYSPKHNPFDEWVYNSADINDSKVVWAREMDVQDNLKLMHYYDGRKVWLAEPDAIPARISPYVIPGQQADAAH
jgi:hypothetical protein